MVDTVLRFRHVRKRLEKFVGSLACIQGKGYFMAATLPLDEPDEPDWILLRH